MIERYIASTGGVGTTYIRKFFGLKNTNENNTISPHMPNPAMIKPNSRVVYVYGNLYNQTLSLYRRGFLKLRYNHCKHVGGDIDGIRARRSWTLDAYLRNGVDFFRLVPHLFRWIDYADRDYTVRFVRYSSVPKYIEMIARWWGLPSEGFAWKARRSNWHKLDKIMQQRLISIFGDDHKRVMELPPYFILKPGEGRDAITQA